MTKADSERSIGQQATDLAQTRDHFPTEDVTNKNQFTVTCYTTCLFIRMQYFLQYNS
jgi:hypothetical protein